MATANYDRCPQCGRRLDYTDERGDVLAYVHEDTRRQDCFK